MILVFSVRLHLNRGKAGSMERYTHKVLMSILAKSDNCVFPGGYDMIYECCGTSFSRFLSLSMPSSWVI